MIELLFMPDKPKLPLGWAQLNFPELQAVNYVRMVTIGDDIYIYGGTNASGSTSAFYKLNVPTNTLTPLSGAPARTQVVMEAVGTKIHIIAGGTNVSVSTHNCYDTVTGEWTTLAPYTPYLVAGSSLVVGDQIYVAGGWLNSNVNLTDVVRRYDPSTDAWTTLAKLPAQRYAGALFQLEPTSIYYTHGRIEQNGAPQTSVWKYTIATNTWAVMPVAPYKTSEVRAAVFDGVAYIYDGLGSGETVDRMCTFDGTTWTTITQPSGGPAARYGYGLTTYRGGIYMYGGGVLSSSTIFKDIWRFQVT
jgi:hypothetical protein